LLCHGKVPLACYRRDSSLGGTELSAGLAQIEIDVPLQGGVPVALLFLPS